LQSSTPEQHVVGGFLGSLFDPIAKPISDVLDQGSAPVRYRIALVVSCIVGILYVASRWSSNTPDRLRLGILGIAVIMTSTIWTALAKTVLPTQHWPYTFAVAWCGLFIGFSGEPNSGVTRVILHIFTYLIFSMVWNMVSSLSEPGANAIYVPLCWSAWQVAFRFVFYYASGCTQGNDFAGNTEDVTEMGLLAQGRDGEDGEGGETLEEVEEVEAGNGDGHDSNNLEDNEVASATSQSEGLHWNVHELPVSGRSSDADDLATEQSITDGHDIQAVAATSEQFITDKLQGAPNEQLNSSVHASTNAADTQLAPEQAVVTARWQVTSSDRLTPNEQPITTGTDDQLAPNVQAGGSNRPVGAGLKTFAGLNADDLAKHRDKSYDKALILADVAVSGELSDDALASPYGGLGAKDQDKFTGHLGGDCSAGVGARWASANDQLSMKEQSAANETYAAANGRYTASEQLVTTHEIAGNQATGKPAVVIYSNEQDAQQSLLETLAANAKQYAPTGSLVFPDVDEQFHIDGGTTTVAMATNDEDVQK
jgi:hypothetical protein